MSVYIYMTVKKRARPFSGKALLYGMLNSGHACLIIKDFHDIMIVDTAHEDVVISF